MLIGKLAKGIANTWTIVGITLAYLVVLEVAASFVLFYKDGREEDHRALADTYQSDNGWTRDYFFEYKESYRTRWQPYVYWRREAYEGKHINVDAEGLRRTWSAKKNPEGDGRIKVIYVFGGSTIWGTGARDDFTIPSLIARQLEQRGFLVRVVNWGESGYVTTQEVILLMRQLQQGNIPDLVVFYDGINDVIAARQKGDAGHTQNEINREKEYNAIKQPSLSFFISSYVKTLSVAKAASYLRYRLGLNRLGSPNGDDVERAQREADSKLAQRVAQVYRTNALILKSLAATYSFELLLYVQPAVFFKDNLSLYEKREKEKQKGYAFLLKTAYAMIASEMNADEGDLHFRDLSQLFRGETEPIFIDWCHLGEKGNEAVARQVSDDIVLRLR